MKYVTLKDAIATAERQHGLHEIDPSSREILQKIASADLSESRICVSDIKNDQIYGTLPTVLTRLQKMVEAGWIERKENTEDRRVVLLQLTNKARSAFKKISKVL